MKRFLIGAAFGMLVAGAIHLLIHDTDYEYRFAFDYGTLGDVIEGDWDEDGAPGFVAGFGDMAVSTAVYLSIFLAGLLFGSIAWRGFRSSSSSFGSNVPPRTIPGETTREHDQRQRPVGTIPTAKSPPVTSKHKPRP